MKFLVCAIAKLENKYIKEWCNHYKQLGFSNIVIYDNNDIDGEYFDEAIPEAIKSGFVLVENVRGEGQKNGGSLQTFCYTECYKKYNSQFDWILFVDCDEFLELVPPLKTISDLILSDRYNKFNSIRICWKNYTDSNIIKVCNEDYNLQKRFTHVLDFNHWRNREYKSLVKCGNSNIVKVTGHTPFYVNACDVYGIKNTSKDCLIGEKPIWDIAYLKHYRTKSIEEFIMQKVVRGTNAFIPNSVSSSLNLFFEYNKKTDEKIEYAKKLLKSFNISHRELVEKKSTAKKENVMEKSNIYSAKFYNAIHSKSELSANIVLDLFFKNIKYPLNNIIDFGCGDGSWLKVCLNRGMKIYGIDGPWVNKGTLQIPDDYFHPFELEENLNDVNSSLWKIPDHDCLMSLEVAEHLSANVADMFVKFICTHCKFCLFSAAIPHQPGSHHINCQWPSYWYEKFKKFDFIMIDNIRHMIWSKSEIPWWYKQNIFSLVKKEFINELIYDERDIVINDSHDAVHPQLFLKLTSK